MTSPAILTVAITGSVPQKADNPAVPITPTEQIEAVRECYDAGAAVAHIHVRNPDGSVSASPDLFAEVQEGVREACPDMIVQFSTSGRRQDQARRSDCLVLRPDMASLATGTLNFVHGTYENDPDLIREMGTQMVQNDIKPEVEIFDLSHLYSAVRYANEGVIANPMHVQFVLGMPGGLPFRREVFEFLLSELRVAAPDATWGVMGIGKDQLTANRWSLREGGHVRTGLEDNIRFDASRLASSNAELVARLAKTIAEEGRGLATPAEARRILGLKPGNKT